MGTAFVVVALSVVALAFMGFYNQPKFQDKTAPGRFGVRREALPSASAAAKKPPVGPRLEITDRSMSVLGKKVKVYGRVKNTGDESLYDVSVVLIPLDSNKSPIKRETTQLAAPLDPGQIQPFYISLELADPAAMKAWTLETRSKYWY